MQYYKEKRWRKKYMVTEARKEKEREREGERERGRGGYFLKDTFFSHKSAFKTKYATKACSSLGQILRKVCIILLFGCSLSSM